MYSVLSSLKSIKFQVFIQCQSYDGVEIFRKIGDVALNDDQIGFCLKTEDCTESIDESLKVETIYPYARKSVQSISVIKILIQSTVLGRAPVLKKLEVLGVPSFRNRKDEIGEIHRLLKITQAQVNNSIVLERKIPEAVDLGFNIPEEFLDAITNDLLVMPFILPSGNVCDESTIGRHNKHEETYGRLPSDPFTGLVYTSDHQPKFDEPLKVRLDEFKLKNSHQIEIKQSGRTVGKKQEPAAASTSGYIANGHVSKKIKLNGSSSQDLDSIISSIYRNNQVSIFTRPKDSRVEENRWTCCMCTSSTPLNCYRVNPCGHLFCKPCLVKLKSSCGVCEASFESKDVTKVNS